MPYSHIDVEWTIVENDAEWKRLYDWSDASVVAASEQPFGHSRFWWRIMALLCVLTLVNGEAWSPNQREQLQTIPELAASIPPLLDNVAVDLTGVLAYPMDAHTSADWQRQFAREEMVLWRGPWPHRAMVQLTTDYHGLEQRGNPLVVDLMTTTTLELWRANPWQLYIPLWCKNPQNKLYMVWWGQHQTLVQLTHLAEPLSTQEYTQTVSVTDRSNSFGQTDRMNYPGQTVTLAMLIDYAAATYGREHLRTLLASLRQYEQWATLIPAVYGVTPAEFEAGWQHYLAARYGISLETITRQ